MYGWSRSHLVDALQQLANVEVKLSRIFGSGLHGQAKFLWLGRDVAVNILQKGHVHIQGKDAGNVARAPSFFSKDFTEPRVKAPRFTCEAVFFMCAPSVFILGFGGFFLCRSQRFSQSCFVLRERSRM